jgi:hypothetical protein
MVNSWACYSDFRYTILASLMRLVYRDSGHRITTSAGPGNHIIFLTSLYESLSTVYCL